MMFLLTPGILELASNYTAIKNSAHFNQVMYKHYQEMYRKHRRSWQFTTAFFMWAKMRHYQNRFLECSINDLDNREKIA